MYVVIWASYAMDALTDVFVSIDLARQDQLTAAIERLSRQMANAPLDVGESRSGNYRLTFVGDLSILFRVDVDRGVDRVTEVKRRGP